VKHRFFLKNSPGGGGRAGGKLALMNNLEKKNQIILKQYLILEQIEELENQL
jgi:hypothetical protein